MVASRFQPSRPAPRRSASGDGTRIRTSGPHLYGRGSGRFPGHFRLRHRRLLGRSVGRSLCIARRALGKRSLELQQHAVRDSAVVRNICYW